MLATVDSRADKNPGAAVSRRMLGARWRVTLAVVAMLALWRITDLLGALC